MSRVDAQAAYNQVGTKYAQGCSGFVCALLGKPWKNADSFSRGASVGSNGHYTGLTPGDLVGFPGHVAVYVGKPDANFVDVNGAGGVVRKMKSYGTQQVFKASY